MTAGASFFIAKVLNDYHPEWASKRWLLFTGALIPPVLVGYCRYRGLLHFPTDILIGIAIGATVGTITPQLHKISKKMSKNISLAPFIGRFTGLSFSMDF
jgi:membrane-associated phospholipid phosphatase